jgi:hypothetical protein
MGEKETMNASDVGRTGSGATAVGGSADPSGPEPAEIAIVKSKSNITNNREAEGSGEPGGGPDEPAESINLNSSRSNIE